MNWGTPGASTSSNTFSFGSNQQSNASGNPFANNLGATSNAGFSSNPGSAQGNPSFQQGQQQQGQQFYSNPGSSNFYQSHAGGNQALGGSSSPFGMNMQQSGYHGMIGSSQLPSGQSMSSPASQQSEVPRYRPGYLTGGMHAQSSPRQAAASLSYDGRSSPEQVSRQTGDSRFGGGREPLFSSSSSSTAAKDSPARSPRATRFGSSRNLAATSRTRQISASTDSTGDYMDEDAPPTDSLAEYDEETPTYMMGGSAMNHHPPPSQQNGNSSRAPLQIGGPPVNQANGRSSNAGPSKVVVFGFQPAQLQSVIQNFQTIAPLVYNSSASGAANNNSENGDNWVTIGYEQESAALRALRKNGDIVNGGIMIGVRWAEGHSAQNGIAVGEEPASSQAVMQIPRSGTQSVIGRPVIVRPANSAYLSPQTKTPSTTPGVTERIVNFGKLDPKAFQQQEEAKQSSGVWGTVSNLIFGI